MSNEPQDGMLGALAEIQRRSLEAAGALVDRLVSVVDGAAPHPTDVDGGDAEAAAPTVPTELLDGWAKLWRDSITSLASTLGDPRATTSAALIVNGASPPAALIVDMATGDPAEVEVWVHNPTEEAQADLRVHCGPLRTHDGVELDASVLGFDPVAFDLPPRSSRGIRVRAHVNGAAAGTYRAVVQVAGLTDQWLPVEIRVPGPTP